MARLDDSAIAQQLATLAGWRREGETIVKELRCGDFAGSVRMLARIAEVADELDHHPDVAISWDRLRLTLTTHSAGGLTERDFELARRIDEIAAQESGQAL